MVSFCRTGTCAQAWVNSYFAGFLFIFPLLLGLFESEPVLAWCVRWQTYHPFHVSTIGINHTYTCHKSRMYIIHLVCRRFSPYRDPPITEKRIERHVLGLSEVWFEVAEPLKHKWGDLYHQNRRIPQFLRNMHSVCWLAVAKMKKITSGNSSDPKNDPQRFETEGS